MPTSGRAPRLEFEALRRALGTKGVPTVACWARVALVERAQRFEHLGLAAASYERRTELNEGLAQYVESRAAGDQALDVLPPNEFGPDSVRDRGYKSGLALGQLLDRLAPAWRDSLERADSSATLDGLFGAALPASGGSCAFSAAERAGATARARSDSAALGSRLAATERDVLSRPGWRVEIEAGGAPFQPAGFDPLNVTRLTPTRVRHGRWVRLANGGGTIDVLGRDAITDAAGPHPLFAGIRSITVTGLAAAPAIRDSSGVLLINAPGIAGSFRGATADTSGTRIAIRTKP